jgi:hypothetical protein
MVRNDSGHHSDRPRAARKTRLRCVICCLIACAMVQVAWGQGVTLTYQGQLQHSGAPHDGTVSLEFRLFDSPTGGSQIGAVVARSDVPVADGLFQAELDFTVFDFESTAVLYLDVTVDGVTLSPRQRITAAPVAAYALWSPAGSGSPWDPVPGGLAYSDGNVGIGSTSFGAASLRVNAGSNYDGVYASTATSNGYAVWGQSLAGSGRGVYGLNSATSGSGAGVFGLSNSLSGTAGYFTGAGTGVYGETTAPGARAGRFVGGQGIRAEPVDSFSTALSIARGNIDHDSGFTIRAMTASMRLSSAGWIALSGASSGDNFRIESDGEIRALGDLTVSGTLSKAGGSFRIDHPLEPANKLLYHSFVESPDMMNVYNGNITTDDSGYAEVLLPGYFEALNRDFRYQLTVIGTLEPPAGNVFPQAMVSSQIEDNRFVIRTNQPHVEVSWQVTGVRQDAWAEANRIPVEVDKSPEQRGRYLHPDAFGLPASKSMDAMADLEPVE